MFIATCFRQGVCGTIDSSLVSEDHEYQSLVSSASAEIVGRQSKAEPRRRQQKLSEVPEEKLKEAEREKSGDEGEDEK